MKGRIALALAAQLAAGVALAKPVPCRGKISGSVTGNFECRVGATAQNQGHYLVFEPLGPVEGVPGYWPGSFELPGKFEVRTYTFEDIVAARASVAKEKGALYTASKTMQKRGEATIELRSVRASPDGKGTFEVHGTYRARLVPVGAGKSGEVFLEVEF